MSFMIPEVTFETFDIIDTPSGIVLVPTGTYSEEEIINLIYEENPLKLDLKKAKEDNLYEQKQGWFARLSAPGYTDCTDWKGPFETEKEAVQALDETYELEDEDLTGIDYKRCSACFLVFPTDYKCECEK